jgi:uncharacterized protein (UPF0335 family)
MQAAKLPPLKNAKTQKELVTDFLKRYDVLRREQEELKEQVKDLEDEFEKDGLDIKTLKMAMRVINIIAKVKHKGTYDEMAEQLEKELVKSV